jgi:hypothetical protein
MHEDEGSLGGRPADDSVLRAREQFDDAVELLSLTKQRLRRGEIAGVRDMASQVALVIKTLIALGDARGKLDDLDRDEAGGGGGALDLDAARAEIGRRLDRLRAASAAR